MRCRKPQTHYDLESPRFSRRAFLQSAAGAGIGMTVADRLGATPVLKNDDWIRVGLIGRDGHTEVILDSLAKIKNVRLVAFAKSRPGEDASWTKEHPAFSKESRIYEDYRELLEKENLNVAGICLPFYQNATVAMEAAQRGIHVISEKPAATSLEDLDRLEESVRKSGVRYTIMLNMRSMPVFQAARTAVQQGMIGEPILVSSQKSYKFGQERPWYYRERKTYGGTLPWVGIHCIDYMRWVSGADYVQVAAHQGNKVHPMTPGCEDYVGALFKLSNGGTAVCHLDYLRPESAETHGDDRLRIAGREGVLEVRENQDQVTVITSSGKTGSLPLPVPIDFFADFIAELRGEGKHLVSAADAFHITRVCLKAREAADSGQWIRI